MSCKSKFPLVCQRPFEFAPDCDSLIMKKSTREKRKRTIVAVAASTMEPALMLHNEIKTEEEAGRSQCKQET